MTGPEAVAPNEHKVPVVYKPNGKLEVSGSDYPPRDLKVGDTITFVPEPDGELELKFDDGSNFSFNGSDVIKGNPAKGVVVREMDDPELKKLHENPDYSELTKNAFPFMCTLVLSEGFSNPKSEGIPNPEVYKGGFPSRRPP
jgi:hypothetical protein